MGTNQANPMEPQDVLPMPYAQPQSNAWARIFRITAILSVLFGAAHAAMGGLMIHVSYVNMNMSFGEPKQLMVAIAIAKIAGGPAAIAGGMMLMRGRGK